MDAPTSPASDPDGKDRARLLEQLMQIARTSALEEMASGFAHELNQPIGAIATFAQAAARMLVKPDPPLALAADVLTQISNEALHAGEGIHRIRNLFNGRESTRAPSEMRAIVEELKPVLGLLATRAGIPLEVSIQDGLPQVAVDRLRIQHVLFTLVQNAIDASMQVDSTTPVRVDVTGDRYAVVTAVTDHGCGIAAAAGDRLFRPFFTTKENGTGLGLASSRAIVEAHEGTIGCDDVAGGGASFWFRLPAASGD